MFVRVVDATFYPVAIMLALLALATSHTWHLVVAVVMCVLVHVIKVQTSVLRPDGTDRLSFPSGHTAVAAFAAVAVARLTYQRTCWPLLGMMTWATLIGYSRVALARHHPSDVIAGSAVGIASALVLF